MVSYVVISWQGLEMVKRIVPLLVKSKDRQIIVVDNGSTDGTDAYLKGWENEVTTVTLDRNYGVAYARNRGIEKATGEWVCILDNDICFEEAAINEMVAYMKSHTDVGLAGCRLLYPDGVVQDSCKLYPGVVQKIKNLLCRGRVRYSYPEKMDSVFEPVYVIGACQLIRKSVIDEAGLLDENIFYGSEDCDYCLRVKAEGWKVVYLPTMSMVHDCQRKTNAHPLSRLGWKHIKGLMYLYRKHRRYID
ncbi:MAG: glycosyltransferase [Paludibacteraceae bacterium]|nr:glycosyltransferase [Paludibacteraceae bacterium]